MEEAKTRRSSAPFVDIFVCGGQEVDDQRTIAKATFTSIEQMFERLQVTLAVRNWDYREEAGEDVELDALSRRSREQAGSSHGVYGIFGSQIPLPVISREEIEEAFERKTAGQEIDVGIFFLSPVSEVHRDWHAQLEQRFARRIVYTEYADLIEFQRKFYARLMLLLIPEFGPMARQAEAEEQSE